MRIFSRTSLATGTVLALALGAPTAAYAQATYSFNLPAQDLGQSLRAVARRTGENIVFEPASVRGRRAAALNGSYSAAQAVERLLAGTGLEARRTSGGSWVVSPGAGETQAVGAAADNGGVGETLAAGGARQDESPEILVTGTRIRGANSPSRVIEVSAEQARDAGFTDVGQIVRSIPQSFSGGQNPGVAFGAGGITNQNISQASSLNLRGLGPDASLTLLNGRRLSYNGFVQAVDVSVIPIGALDRIEVIADGASAIYGSDAVGGVANIILRRDFEGVDVRSTLGFATQGGGELIQTSLTTGTTWRSGGVLAAYEYIDRDEIFADQRDFTQDLVDPAGIYPSQRQHSLVLSAHQELAEGLEVRTDGLYTYRTSTGLISTQPTQRALQGQRTEVFTIAPTVELSLPAEWRVRAGGSYSQDTTLSRARAFSLTGTQLLFESIQCYCNHSFTAEIDAEGPLFALPGDDLRVAIGGGYRRNDYLNRNFTSGARLEGSSDSFYAFGEIYAPIVEPNLEIPGLSRLTVTAALRYENYGGTIGEIATPRLGVIYSPIPDLTFRGSWGRSFKAPTLTQQFQAPLLILYPVTTLGGTGFPAGSTALMTFGGNRNLAPERAKTWSATATFTPEFAPGLRLEVGYFDVDYRDRVLQPLFNPSRTFIDAIYANFITLNPSAATQAQLIANSTGGFLNAAGVAYDPATVVAIADNLYQNVAKSRVSGFDAAASYNFNLAGGRAELSGSATWLEGTQQNVEGQPGFQVVGIIANPPEFRARGGFTWSGSDLTLAAFVNHLGGVLDNRFTPFRQTDSFTTVDATVRYRPSEQSRLGPGFEVALSVQNLFDQAPPSSRPLGPGVTVGYDSTNYSPIGRYVTLTLAKRF